MQKVAAYCRVSTNAKEQLHSLEAQKQYFTEYINKNNDWILTRIYYDEGLSGTSLDTRIQLNQLVEDAIKGGIDLILTKEVSRWARNTIDALSTLRLLKAHNVNVWFITDGIDTKSPDWELRLTILAGFAQEESRKISERTKWGIKRAMESGKVIGSAPYGYKNANGKLKIVSEEAEIVRLIFHKYLEEGKGIDSILVDLNSAGIFSRGGSFWARTTVHDILRNEKYTGDLVQGKKYTPNFLDHKTKRVADKNLYITKENSHEAIIEKEYFDKVQAEIERRAAINYIPINSDKKHSWLSSKVKCGLCGHSYMMHYIIDKNNNKVYRWVCVTRSHMRSKKEVNGVTFGCNGSLIKDDTLEQGVRFVFKSFILESDFVRQGLITELQYIKDIKATKDTQKEIKLLDLSLQKAQNRKKILMDRLVDEVITKEDYGKYNDELNSEISALYEKRSSLVEAMSVDFSNQIRFLENCIEVLDTFSESETITDKYIMGSLVSKVEILPEKTFKIFLLGMDKSFKMQYNFVREGNKRNLELVFLGVE